MPRNPRILTFLAVLLLVAAGGAGCPRAMTGPYSAMPRTLPPQPTLEQVIQTVNANSSQIESFSTNRATISVPGAPALRASVAFEQPGRLRIQADTPMSAGPEFDLGSNDEEFWFFFRGDPQKAVYYCRHDQFNQSPARTNLPIAPGELLDALGLAQFDPALAHEGPVARRDGKLVVRTIRQTEEGPVTKVTVVDPWAGSIVEQQFYDARGQLALQTLAWQHRRDPASGRTMPRVIDVICPPARFRMRVNLGDVAINTPLADRGDLWMRPQFAGFSQVNLGDPNFHVESAPTTQPPLPGGAASRALHRRSW
jgi:hypothetical protein